MLSFKSTGSTIISQSADSQFIFLLDFFMFAVHQFLLEKHYLKLVVV